MDLRTALRQGRELLEGEGIEAARQTAEALLVKAISRERNYLYSHPEHVLAEIEWLHYGRYLHERISGKPSEYILKTCEFYGRSFTVNPSVLIPRPETEHLVERALSLAQCPRRIADICTGSGILAVTLSIELHAEFAVATDISPGALAVAAGNARAHGVNAGFVLNDLMDGLHGGFDLIAANPPYIPSGEIGGLQREVREHEPRVALDGGPDGLDVYRRLIPQAFARLVPGGWLLMEIGHDQGERIASLLNGWTSVRISPDLAGHSRIAEARKPI